MKLLLSTLILGIILTSCSTQTNGEHSRIFDTNKSLALNQNEPFNSYTIIAGDGIVFEFRFVHPQDDNISDDELTEVFIFSIPEDQTSFEFTNEDLVSNPDLLLAYSRLCFCGFGENFETITLTATGNKISSTRWEVYFDVSFKSGEYTFSLSDEGIYYKGDL